MPISLDADIEKSEKRQETNRYRLNWREFGFRMVSGYAADEDRQVILSVITLLRCLRVAEMAYNENTEFADIRWVASRNLAATPREGERGKIMDKAANSKELKNIKTLLELHDYHMSKVYGAKGAFASGLVTDANKKVAMEARALASNNVAVAYFELAKAVADNAEAFSVFGLVVPHSEKERGK